MPFIGLGVLVLIALLSWVVKIIYRKRLERGLGRRVKDNELTSITAWMDAEPRDKKG